MEQFLQSPIGRHFYSFIKTYITVFIGTYLALNGLLDEINTTAITSLNLLDINTFLISAKFALISVLRNFYKLLTE